MSGGMRMVVACTPKGRRHEDSGGLRGLLWARLPKRREASSQSSNGENISRQTDSGGATNRRYTLKPMGFGELISQDDSFHHYDALGNTDRITNASEVEQVARRYRAFGEQTVVSGSSPNRFTWVGRLGYYRQPDTNDYWVRARIYRPGIGGWVSRDPVRWLRVRWPYLYAMNRPICLTDPSGLKSSAQCCGRLRQKALKVHKDIKPDYPQMTAPGFYKQKREELNNLVHQLGHDCDDHSLDKTYQEDCPERRKPDYDDCMEKCMHAPIAPGPGGKALAVAHAMLAAADTLEQGQSGMRPNPTKDRYRYCKLYCEETTGYKGPKPSALERVVYAFW